MAFCVFLNGEENDKTTTNSLTGHNKCKGLTRSLFSKKQQHKRVHR